MSSVLIGRRELFAFADRYASHRLKDYNGLADGEVLSQLFSTIFPAHAIRPASSHTHSQSQRAQINWDALFRGFARLHIPVALLDPMALAVNNAEKGFSTLVLFYFLFHLSKRTDFTAEFALDISEELTEYLQSVDSIASLLLGEALDWDVLPDDLGESIRALPSFHLSPQQQSSLEEEASKLCRSIMGASTALRGTNPSNLHKLKSVDQNVASSTRTRRAAKSNSSTGVSPTLPSRTDFIDTPPQQSASASSPAPQPKEDRDLSKPVEGEAYFLDVIQQLKSELLASKDSERSLKAENAQLRNDLLNVQRGADTYSKQVLHKSDALDPSAAGGLLEDVVDAESGEVVDVHKRASLLHCLMLEHLHAFPTHRVDAQSSLWSIVAAYHVLETRLVTAVDIIDTLRECIATQDCESTSRLVDNAQSNYAESLRRQHAVEHNLKAEVSRLKQRLDRVVSIAAERESKWKQLCSALHSAECLSLSLTRCTTEAEVEDTLLERGAHYRAIQTHTEFLLSEAQSLAAPDNDTRATADDPCHSMQLLLQASQEECARLRHHLAALQEKQQPLHTADDVIFAALSEQQDYEVDALRPFREKFTLRSPNTLSTPPPITRLDGSSSRTQPAAMLVKGRALHADAAAVSPYGKDLSALLAEASTSPYQLLAA